MISPSHISRYPSPDALVFSREQKRATARNKETETHFSTWKHSRELHSQVLTYVMADNRNESDSRRRIPKLEGSQDFSVWRIYLMELLDYFDVLNVITDPEPDPGSSATIINHRNKANNKARSKIVFNLGTEPIAVISQLLTDRASAVDVWKKLESSYHKENVQSKLNLRKKLHSMLFKEGQTPKNSSLPSNGYSLTSQVSRIP